MSRTERRHSEKRVDLEGRAVRSLGGMTAALGLSLSLGREEETQFALSESGGSRSQAPTWWGQAEEGIWEGGSIPTRPPSKARAHVLPFREERRRGAGRGSLREEDSSEKTHK